MSKVIKRDGRIVLFDKDKIVSAVTKAMSSIEEMDEALALSIAKDVDAQLNGSFEISVEDIQDIVENFLMAKASSTLAKSYILYRHKRAEVREVKDFLGIEDDLKFGVNALALLDKRYLKTVDDKKETPSQMFRRVARSVASVERKYGNNPAYWSRVFYNLMSNQIFMPNTPCVPSGTKIITGSGVQSIECIEVGDMVVTHNNKLKPVTKTFVREYSGDVIKIRVKGTSNPLTFTPDHPIYSVLATCRCCGSTGRYLENNLVGVTFNNADSIVKGDLVALSFNSTVGNKTVSPDFARFLGYWFGDGYSREYATSVCFNSKQNEWVKDCAAIISSEFGLDPKYEYRDNAVIVGFNSKEKSKLFISFGKSLSRTIPSYIMESDIKTQRQFLIGIYRAEGSCTSREIEWSVRNELLAKQVKQLLFRIGIVPRLSARKNGDYRIVFSKRKAPEFVNEVFGGGLVKHSTRNDFPTINGILFAPVLSVERCQFSGKVYNIEVADDNSYSVENVSVHNCLANAGNKELNCLFACYAFNVGDSIDEIFQTVKDCAIVQKTGGGVGLCLSDLRPCGDVVKSTEGVATGPVDFMRAFDITSDVIKQGGIRRGGNLGLLSINHPDIVRFIKCKENEKLYNNFNISVSIPDSFMRAVKNDSEVPLINPHTRKTVNKVKARELFRLVAESAWNNGEPGIIFWDKLQADNPTPSLGDLIVNLCGEQPLLPYEACCLGSINLAKFADDGKIIYSSLKKVVQHTVRFLDNVIDASDYPLEKIRETVMSNRKIGLGIMGFADLLFYLGIPYNSDDALVIAEEIMDFINVEAIRESKKLAEDRGDFPNILISPFDSPMRNATLTTIAPTGSVSMIAETSNGMEPVYGIVFSRQNILEGRSFFEVNKAFESIAKREGWYSQELITRIAKNKGSVNGISDVPKNQQKILITALEVEPEWHVKMQAAFQKHISNSISKTVNLPTTATVDDVEKIIKLGYDCNLKGLTVFRNESRSEQVMKTNDLCIECDGGTCSV